jgi:hypothetical protein
MQYVLIFPEHLQKIKKISVSANFLWQGVTPTIRGNYGGVYPVLAGKTAICILE